MFVSVYCVSQSYQWSAGPRVSVRVDLCLFKRRFPSMIAELENYLSVYENSLKNLLAAENDQKHPLSIIFAYILAVGNYVSNPSAHKLKVIKPTNSTKFPFLHVIRVYRSISSAKKELPVFFFFFF